MDSSGITSKQVEAMAGKSPESILRHAKIEGIELSDEQLDQVAGGGIWDDDDKKGCPECGSTDFAVTTVAHVTSYWCRDCGCKWS